jgi:hypothetical protein
MDYVDDFKGRWCSLDELDLADEYKDLLHRIATRFNPLPVRYFILARGLSTAAKVVAKPQTLFPLLVKLDTDENIRAEVKGDQLLRYRLPPLAMPPLEAVEYGVGCGAIAYRYITGGRVRDVVRRFDRALTEMSTYRALQIIDDIFDVIMKKCHWLDGRFEMRPINLPLLAAHGPAASDPECNDLLAMYDKARKECAKLKAPYGVVHGDLHAKNVLVTRDDAPVLVDFARARDGECQMLDFATFEAPLQFQVDRPLAEKFWEMEDLQYGETALIIPHSNSKLAACVHRVRSNLWQGCTRRAVRMPLEEVDLAYRGYLMCALLRLYLRYNNDPDTRLRAAKQVRSLSRAFS